MNGIVFKNFRVDLTKDNTSKDKEVNIKKIKITLFVPDASPQEINRKAYIKTITFLK